MGLIARALETRGIPTVTLTSARSITESVGAPRSVYIDYPLGQTAGRAGDQAEQRYILEAACQAFESITSPGSIIDLPLEWSEDDSWKEAVMRPESSLDPTTTSKSIRALSGDQRTARCESPQYQYPEDSEAAALNCPSCVFLE